MAKRPDGNVEETDDDRLFLLLPRAEDADDDAPDVVLRHPGGQVVGVVVRGVPERVEGIPLPYRGARQVDEPRSGYVAAVAAVRDILAQGQPRGGAADLPVHIKPGPGSDRESGGSAAVAGLPGYVKPGASGAENVGEVPLELLDALIKTTEAQLTLLLQIRATSARSRRERITLKTATEDLEYALPLSRDETYGSTAVSQILSPTGKSHRTIAQHRRRANDLLGIKIGNQYRYPKFQIDPIRHEIRPIVAYTNRTMECDADPWGTLDWWFSENEALHGRRPVDMVDSGELTRELVDYAIRRGRQPME